MDTESLLTCYNKGCGQKYDPNDNEDGKCIFHSGAPYFHDVYKGWTCCKKKSTDFTEFLNMKGCCVGKHSNIKPVEPEKSKQIEEYEIKVTGEDEERKPIEQMTRPSFDSPCIQLECTVNPAFKQQMDQLVLSKKLQNTNLSDEKLLIGTTCKNGGCGKTYESTATNQSPCVHHPGVPVFHEGYKYWSCCQRKTSDFSAFLSQAGCETGKHKWIQEGAADKINCRWDWHQTASEVVVAIYAKNYDYQKSYVKVNPIRLTVKIIFPQQSNAQFNLDLELRGVIKVSQSEARMYGTKIEVTLPKAEPGHWVKFNYPREIIDDSNQQTADKTKDTENNNSDKVENDESDVDLDDIEPVVGVKITELASARIN